MPLSDLQRRCATIILQLSEAAGFALAGGAAHCVASVVVEVFGDEGPGVVSFTLYGESRALPVLS